MKEKKPNKKKIQGAETKKKLFEIAKELFAEHDYNDVSVEDITDAAGITKGAFYVHFESKDALIAVIIAEYTARIDMDYKAFLEMLPDDMPTSEVLFALTDKIADVLIDSIGYENMKKVYQMLLVGTVDTEAIKGHSRELYTLFYNILKQGFERGEFQSTIPVDVLSRHFVMAIRGISYEWCIRYPDFDLKEQAKAHIQLLLEGITK